MLKIAASDSLITRHLTIRLDAVLQAEQLSGVLEGPLAAPPLISAPIIPKNRHCQNLNKKVSNRGSVATGGTSTFGRTRNPAYRAWTHRPPPRLAPAGPGNPCTSPNTIHAPRQPTLTSATPVSKSAMPARNYPSTMYIDAREFFRAVASSEKTPRGGRQAAYGCRGSPGRDLTRPDVPPRRTPRARCVDM